MGTPLRHLHARLWAAWLRRRRLRVWPRQRHEIEQHLEWIVPGWEPREDPTQLVVVALMRDAEEHVESFVEHHLRLGASGIVLLDNGSRDATLQRAAKLDRVTLLRCGLPYKTHSYAYKRYLIERFGEGCWCLLADIDERFDYPASDRLRLTGFLGYLNARGYDAVMAQMLDLFPDGPPSSWPHGGSELIAASVWYDLSAVEARPPGRAARVNRFADPRMNFYSGGIRFSAFGATPVLTKFPLLFRRHGRGPVLESAHLCRGGRVADVSGVLLHYKYDRHFLELCRRAVAEGNFFANSGAYRLYLGALERRPDLVLRTERARRYAGPDELVSMGLLAASAPYREYVEQAAQEAIRLGVSAGRPTAVRQT
jgi:hypothetical protein